MFSLAFRSTLLAFLTSGALLSPHAYATRFGLSRFVSADKFSPCERMLITYSDEQVENDLYAQVHNTYEIHPFSDHIQPHLLLLEPLDGIHQQPHEVRTARDYAKYIHDTHNKNFLFLASFEGRSVPVFDGVIVHGTRPITNISLKYVSLKAKTIDIESFLEKLRMRLHLREEVRRVGALPWFQSLSGAQLFSGIVMTPYYKERMKIAAKLGSLFNLFKDSQWPLGREYRTVLDLRNSGFTYEFINRPENLEAIRNLVDNYADRGFTLTLLWDSKRVLQF